MDNTTDLLQIKIDEAKAQLPEDIKNAINAVDYKAVILEMRKTKGYSFEQLGDLETETELLLCGLIGPENYPKELEARMRLSKSEVNELIREMNDRVFAKIKENLVKKIEGKTNNNILSSAGIEIISDSPTKKEPAPIHPIMAQKLSASFQVPIVATEHSLNNITKNVNVDKNVVIKSSRIDPYREMPE